MGYRISITLLVKLNCLYPAGPYYQSNRGFNQKTIKRKACLHQTDLYWELNISDLLWQMASPCSIKQIGKKNRKTMTKNSGWLLWLMAKLEKPKNKKMQFLLTALSYNDHNLFNCTNWTKLERNWWKISDRPLWRTATPRSMDNTMAHRGPTSRRQAMVRNKF